MTRGLLHKLLNQLLIVDLLICLAAYILQTSHARFTWVLAVSLIVLFWLFVAKFFAFLDSAIQR